MFWRIANFSKVAAPFYTAPSRFEGSDCFTSLPALVTVCFFFGYSHPSRHRVVSHCGFDAHFPNDSNSQGWLVSYWDHTTIKPRVISVYLLLPLLAYIKAYWVLEKSSPGGCSVWLHGLCSLHTATASSRAILEILTKAGLG